MKMYMQFNVMPGISLGVDAVLHHAQDAKCVIPLVVDELCSNEIFAGVSSSSMNDG